MIYVFSTNLQRVCLLLLSVIICILSNTDSYHNYNEAYNVTIMEPLLVNQIGINVNCWVKQKNRTQQSGKSIIDHNDRKGMIVRKIMWVKRKKLIKYFY